MKIKSIVQTVLFFAIAIAMLIWLDGLFMKKYSSIKYKDFYESNNNYDVLFYGSSLVQTGIFPTQLWEDYGILSYNMGNYGEDIPMTYWVMKNSFDYYIPKIAIVDITMIRGKHDVKNDTDKYHYFFDTLPLSMNKYDAVNDVVAEGHRAQYLWTFSTYHTRWNELFNKEYDECRYAMGAAPHMQVVYQERETIDDTREIFIQDEVKEYLTRMEDLCEERGVHLIYTCLPKAKDDNIRKWCKEYAKETGIEYIDFYELDVVDKHFDFYDGAHMNSNGAIKVTRWLGDYLMKKDWGLSDNRDNQLYSKWTENCKLFNLKQFELFKNLQTLPEYLEFIAYKELEAKIYIPKNSTINDDEDIQELLQNIDSGHSSLFSLVDDETCVIKIEVYDSSELIDSANFVDNGSPQYERVYE